MELVKYGKREFVRKNQGHRSVHVKMEMYFRHPRRNIKWTVKEKSMAIRRREFKCKIKTCFLSSHLVKQVCQVKG